MKVYIKSSLAVLLVSLCSSLIILGSYALYILNCSSPIGSRVVVDKDILYLNKKHGAKITLRVFLWYCLGKRIVCDNIHI